MSSRVSTVDDGKAIHLFFDSPNDQRSRHDPGFLASNLGLAVHGSWLLTNRGRVELTAISVVLIIIFLFDWMAWTLLFNAILSSEILAWNQKTIFAAAAGTLFASVVMVYERQFVSSDTSLGWRKQAIPILIRLVIIGTSAMITAQPVHLLFFREPILNRVHEEGIRSHALTILEKIDAVKIEKNQANDAISGMDNIRECKNRESATQDLYDSQEREIELQSQLVSTKSSSQYWKGEISRLSGLVIEAEAALRQELANLSTTTLQNDFIARKAAAEKAEENFQSARLRRGNAEKKYQAARDKTYTLGKDLEEEGLRTELWQERLADWDKKCAKLQQDTVNGWEERTDNLSRQTLVMKSWIQNLTSTSPEEADRQTTEIGGVPFTYRLPKYDFFAQLRVLHDLKAGEPPRWIGSDGETIVRGATELGLHFPKTCSSGMDAEEVCSQEEISSWKSIQAQSKHFRWAYFAVYGIAIVIPALALAMKFLLPEDLVSYYSTRRQARAGNPEARRLLAAMDEETS